MGTVTFLLSDVEGSTGLWEADQDSAAAAIARHYELFDAAISLHGGVRPEEQGEGDSVVGAFALASDALGAALDVQRAFATETWPTEQELRVRIALHSGTALLRDEGNYYGPAIIRCARLRSVAHGGQILLSDVVRDLVVDRLPEDVSLRNLGPRRLKDLGRPERVWQLCHPDIRADFPPLRSLDVFPNNLPAQLTAFVGRDAEIAELRGMLAQHRLVTLTGAGGCGKTRLAVQLGAEVADFHPGGTWWVELAGLSDPELVTAAVASAIGVRAEPERPLIDTVAEYLGGLGALIVLDNCEQVLSSIAEFADVLLRSVPDLSVLATSREPLGITGELAWRVPSLDPASSVQLFIDRAALVRPGFMPEATEIGCISRICERLDGLPLAIELAAARIRMMSPAAIASALEDRFRLLTGGGRSAQPRQQTLEASVAWSHDLLDEPERALLRRLSVFNTGFTLEAAEVVCADGSVDSYSILDLLGRLVDKSLVQADDLASGSRYRLLETIRHYARDRLFESAEVDQVRTRHLAWFLAYAEQAEPELGAADGQAWMGRLDEEHDNLQSALEWAETTGDHEAVLRLVAALGLFWEARGHRAQGVGGRWFARALAVDHGPSVARARALWAGAHIGIYGGDPAITFARAPEALRVARAVGDQRTIIRANITIGYAMALMAPQEGLAGLTDNIELARSTEDQWAVCDGLKMLTIGGAARGDYDDMIEAARELAVVANRLGNKFFQAWSHATVAYVALRRGDLATARSRLETSIALCDDVGDPITRWIALCWLGEIDAQTGDHVGAQARYEQVLSKGLLVDGDLARHWAIPDLGALLLARGDVAGASRVIEPHVADFDNEVSLIRVPFLLVYGELLAASGDEAGAHAEFDRARQAASQVGHSPFIAAADYRLGQLARQQGEPAEAEDHHHRALAVRHQNRLVGEIAESLDALAGIAAEQGSASEAARLLGAAQVIGDTTGRVRLPVARTLYEQDLARTHQQLDDEAFETSWTAGASLSVDDVVAYAFASPGRSQAADLGLGQPHPYRAGGGQAHRGRAHQPRDRRTVVHQQGHREDTSGTHLHQNRCHQPC